MRRLYPYILFLPLLCFNACSISRDADPETVAKIGEHIITYQELEVSFMLEPMYAIRTPLLLARETQLAHLIDQEYYFLTAETTGLGNDASILAKMAYIEQQEVLKAFIREQFLDSVSISPDDMIGGLQRYARMLHIRNIFRKERDDIRRIHMQLERHPESVGEIFDVMGVDLGWITFGMIDPELEKAAYALDAGGYSDVIATEGGFHLLFVEGTRINNDYQQVNQRMRMEQVGNALRKRKAHAGILKFLNQRAGSRKIQINNRVTDQVAAAIKSDTDESSGDPTILQPPISRDELDLIEMDLMTISDVPIARFGDVEMSVGAFLQRLKEMPPYHRPYIKGRTRLVQVLLDLLRNDMLTAAAIEQGYPMKTNVREEIDKYRRDLLADEFSRIYHDPEFRSAYPDEWAGYDRALKTVRDAFPAEIYTDHLFTKTENPDSLLTDAPIPVFLKSRYRW